MVKQPPCPLCGRPKIDRDLFGVVVEWTGWACRDCQNAGGLCHTCGQPAPEPPLCPLHWAQKNEDDAIAGLLDDDLN